MRLRHTPASVAMAALLAVGLAAPGVAFCLHAAEVRDLDYGAVLFDVYQDRFYNAAVSLHASRDTRMFGEHKDEAELLLGAMYLSYGVHDEAERIFHRLLGSQTTPDIRNRVWFYLAKVRYQRGLHDAAQQALAQIQGALPSGLSAEHQRLNAHLMLMRGQYEDAIVALKSAAEGQDDAFARYNLAIARRQAGDMAGAERDLLALIAQPATQDTVIALQDQARISLAFQKLREGKQPEAGEYLDQVALDGPYSEQALLGRAWAEMSQNRFARAVVPLQVLQQRTLSLSEVQEGWLLHAYIYEQAGDHVTALKMYRQALELFRQEQDRLDDAVASLDDGRFMSTLLPQLRGDAQGWGWAGELAPEGAAGAYIGGLMARHTFFEALRNLRDLQFLAQRLQTWKRALPGYESMVQTRKDSYQAFLPQLTQFQQDRQYEDMQQRRDALANELQQIEQRNDVLRVATPEQAALARRLERVRARLDAVPDNGKTADAHERLRRMAGLLLWDMEQDFKPRLWERRKLLREIDNHLEQTQQRQTSIQEARLATPEMFDDYQARLKEIETRIPAMETRVAAAHRLQEQALLSQAREELQRRRERLLLYRDQARFALARIKDISSDLEETRP